MLEVNFIRGGGDMYGLQASTAIINSGIFFFFSAPVSLIQVGTDNLTPPSFICHIQVTDGGLAP